MTDKALRILVIKLRYLGDVLLTTPVFEALRLRFPDAYIAALVNRETEDMLTDNPAIDRIFTMERDIKLWPDLQKQRQLIRDIRSEKFDVAIDLTWNDRAAVLAKLSGARKRLSYLAGEKKLLHRSSLFTDLIKGEKNLHMVKKHLEMAKALQCASLPGKISLYWSEKDQRDADAILQDNRVSDNLPFVVMHPSSRALHKVWTAEGYAAVCDYLSEKHGLQTILICGKDEKELDGNRAVGELARTRPVNFGGKLSLKQTAVLLSRAVLFIGIDSGPMHMATAVNTPVAAIFGPSRSWRWGPWGEGHTVIQKEWPCVPCGRQGCEGKGRSRCLDELTVAEVIAVLDPQIEKIKAARGMKTGAKKP